MFKPQNTKELRQAVDEWCGSVFGWVKAWYRYGHIGTWDVSEIEDMSFLFKDKKLFNSDISKWDVSNVKYFSCMFQGCFLFNQNLNDWNVSNGVLFGCMFNNTFRFNQPVDRWDMRKALNISGMFANSYSFNQSLNSWKLDSIKSIYNLLDNTCFYNQQLDWDIRSLYFKTDCYDLKNLLGRYIGGVPVLRFAEKKMTHQSVKNYLMIKELDKNISEERREELFKILRKEWEKLKEDGKN